MLSEERKYPDSSRQAGDANNRPYKRALLVGAVFALMLLAVVCRDILLPYLPGGLGETTVEGPAGDEFQINQVSSAEQMMEVLKNHSLWDMPFDAEVPPIIFANYPYDFNQLEVEIKKNAFLNALLPAILLVQAEIEKEREVLEQILTKYETPRQVTFSEEEDEWREGLALAEIEFIEHLTVKYRSERATDLLARVDTLPASLIMAQAAIESSWGSSRFAKKGNNLFGLWTWVEPGLVPSEREEGKNHKVAIYDSILDSTRAYLLTINRLPAYRTLRQLRTETRDPLLLAEGLRLYSARREKYVAELKSIIRHNQLDRYDQYSLAGELPAGSAQAIKVSKLVL
jgi:Bax protein